MPGSLSDQYDGMQSALYENLVTLSLSATCCQLHLLFVVDFLHPPLESDASRVVLGKCVGMPVTGVLRVAFALSVDIPLVTCALWAILAVNVDIPLKTGALWVILAEVTGFVTGALRVFFYEKVLIFLLVTGALWVILSESVNLPIQI